MKSRNVSLVANRSISILNVVQIITYTDVYERISTDEGPKVIQKDSSKIEIRPKIIFVWTSFPGKRFLKIIFILTVASSFLSVIAAYFFDFLNLGPFLQMTNLLGVPNYKTEVMWKRFITWFHMHANSIIKPKKNQKKDAIVKLILTFGKEKFWILVISKIFSIIETNNFLNFRTTFEQFSESALVSSFLFHNFGQKWPLHFK